MNFCDYELAEEWKLKNATYAANAIEMGAWYSSIDIQNLQLICTETWYKRTDIYLCRM